MNKTNFLDMLYATPEFGNYDPDVRNDLFNEFDPAADDSELSEVTEAAKTLVNAVNRYKAEEVARAFARGFVSEHRTLQNSAFKALFSFFRMYQSVAYDGRNRVAVVAAKRVTQLAEDENIGFPLI